MSDLNNILYPELNTFTPYLLKVDEVHEVYYEVCGNPAGIPVVFLHGGPGSGCNPTQRRFFDPAFYQIILIDQRGCGRSKPLGALVNNTTDDLVRDMELIRQVLNIEAWLVFGGSWGSTLALCYALAHPQRVTGLILRGVFLSRPTELHWFLKQVTLFFPEAMQTLCEFIPEGQRDNPVMTYEQLIGADDPAVSIPAAIRWNAFESSIMTLLPRPATNQAVNGDVELARARVQIHYIQNHCFVGERDLLAEARQWLSHIPTTIVQGRYDMVCPPMTAWELGCAMPHANFQMIEDAGHSAMEAGIAAALVAAMEQFKQIVQAKLHLKVDGQK